jgi:hypothetical protein
LIESRQLKRKNLKDKERVLIIKLKNQGISTKMEGPSPRIVKESKNIITDPVPGIKFTPDQTNFRHFFIEV